MYIAAYALIVLLATTVGAISGLGGGVIIKPALDFMGRSGSAEIALYSACCVFCMCVVSLYKQLRARANLSRTLLVWVSTGSLAGGLLGEQLFAAVRRAAGNDAAVKLVQSSVLLLVLVLIVLYVANRRRVRKLSLPHGAAGAAAGLVLGVVSVFLGIGGGPLNIALLCLCFNLTVKEAVPYSLFTIFFAQISKLTLVAVSEGFAAFALPPLPFMLAAAVLGGYTGSLLNKRMSERQVEGCYMATMLALCALCAVNILRAWKG